jgi:hypothetical protein
MGFKQISSLQFSFWRKVLASLVLVALADWLFFAQGVGATLGGFALAWLVLTLILQPAVWRNRRALTCATAAGLFALVLIDHFSLIGWALFWVAITISVLSPGHERLPSAWNWTRLLLVHACVSVAGPIYDVQRLRRLTPPGRASWQSLVTVGALPLCGGAVFLALFALANPIIAGALSGIRFPEISLIFVLRVIFWAGVCVATWATLRPFRARRRYADRAPQARAMIMDQPGVSVASVTLALIVFNTLFAVENALDLTFLWSGAGLPSGMTLAQYAHRGAYPLIATALLAGGFSLFILREGSETASRPLIRLLVGLWVGQNVLLSASSLLRTIDYVQAYSLTRFRLAALLWMGLVTVGLVLIGWRMLRRKSGVWLINANAVALGVVLCAVSFGDLGAVAASWNVRHASDAGGAGARLDVCYLQTLGPSALLPLMALEQRPLGPELRARVVDVQWEALNQLRFHQLQWRRWTWRGERRLHTADILLASQPQLGRSPLGAFTCDQQHQTPPPAQPPAPPTSLTPDLHASPLTGGA